MGITLYVVFMRRLCFNAVMQPFHAGVYPMSYACDDIPKKCGASKSIKAMLKEIRAKRQSVTPIIADAIEYLVLDREAQVSAMIAIMDEKIRKVEKTNFWWSCAVSASVLAGFAAGAYYAKG